MDETGNWRAFIGPEALPDTFSREKRRRVAMIQSKIIQNLHVDERRKVSTCDFS
jgi:hypothetical protein